MTPLPQNPFHCPPVAKDFTGRENELKELHDKCSSQHAVVVSGLGGVGKTSLVLKYAHEHKSDYRWIRLIDSSTPETVVSELLLLADDFGIPLLEKAEDRLQRLKSHLESIDSNYLLIFDGVDRSDTYDIINKYRPSIGKILLTSRLKEEGHAFNFDTVELKLFTEREAIDFLCKATTKNDEQDAKRLAEKLGFLPLALSHTASYIRVQKCSFEKYLERFERYSLKLFERKYLRLRAEEKTVLTTWQITMDMIENQEESSVAQLLLNFLSFLASSNIPYEALKQWSTQEKVDELELDRTLGLLMNYSILSKTDDRYTIHPLVQMTMQFQLKDEERQSFLDQGIKVFSDLKKKYDIEKIEHREQIRAIVANCETLLGYFDYYRLDCKREYHLQMLSYLRLYYQHWGQLSKAHEYAKKNLELADRSYPDLQHPEVATSLYNMSSVLETLGNYDKALELIDQSILIRENLLGSTHQDTITALEKKGDILWGRGLHQKALDHEFNLLKIKRKACQEDSLAVAMSYDAIGGNYYYLCNYKEAYEFQIKALNIRKNLLGERHPDTAAIHNDIGLTLYKLGLYDESVRYYNLAIDFWETMYGKEHYATATGYSNLGNCLQAIGSLENAYTYKKKALEIRKKTFGKKHPRVATSYNSLGESFESLGEHKEALKYKLKALEIRKELLGEGSEFTAISYESVSKSFEKQGQNQKALEFKQKASEIRQKLGIAQ